MCPETANHKVGDLIPFDFCQVLTLLEYKKQMPHFLKAGECLDQGLGCDCVPEFNIRDVCASGLF